MVVFVELHAKWKLPCYALVCLEWECFVWSLPSFAFTSIDVSRYLRSLLWDLRWADGHQMGVLSGHLPSTFTHNGSIVTIEPIFMLCSLWSICNTKRVIARVVLLFCLQHLKIDSQQSVRLTKYGRYPSSPLVCHSFGAHRVMWWCEDSEAIEGIYPVLSPESRNVSDTWELCN